MKPSLSEILALDLLTLREHTERAGDVFDADRHRAALQVSMDVSHICSVRRAGQLVAYAMLRRESQTCWFVTGLGTHPLHRTAGVVRELLSQLAGLATTLGIVAMRSHVYKTNHLSMAFHRKLGFNITRENQKGVEFFALVSTLGRHSLIQRVANNRPAA
jgi:ribosomal protein S18 acetylase RimI-like enzyme